MAAFTVLTGVLHVEQLRCNAPQIRLAAVENGSEAVTTPAVTVDSNPTTSSGVPPTNLRNRETRQDWFYACPFQFLRPQEFPRCSLRLRNVSEVKRHLIKSHYLHCPKCQRPFEDQPHLTAHYHKMGCDNTGHISEEQLATIKKRPNSNSTDEQRFWDVFTTIFPGNPEPQTILDREGELQAYSPTPGTQIFHQAPTAAAAQGHELRVGFARGSRLARA